MILTIHRHVISRIPRYSVTFDNSNTWVLHVKEAHQEDRGYYMCQVNTNPMISQVGYLQVVGKLTRSKASPFITFFLVMLVPIAYGHVYNVSHDLLVFIRDFVRKKKLVIGRG